MDDETILEEGFKIPLSIIKSKLEVTENPYDKKRRISISKVKHLHEVVINERKAFKSKESSKVRLVCILNTLVDEFDEKYAIKDGTHQKYVAALNTLIGPNGASRHEFAKETTSRTELGQLLTQIVQYLMNDGLNFKQPDPVNHPEQEFEWVGKLKVGAAYDESNEEIDPEFELDLSAAAIKIEQSNPIRGLHRIFNSLILDCKDIESIEKPSDVLSDIFKYVSFNGKSRHAACLANLFGIGKIIQDFPLHDQPSVPKRSSDTISIESPAILITSTSTDSLIASNSPTKKPRKKKDFNSTNSNESANNTFTDFTGIHSHDLVPSEQPESTLTQVITGNMFLQLNELIQSNNKQISVILSNSDISAELKNDLIVDLSLANKEILKKIKECNAHANSIV